jgi:hypothetical protein
MHSMKHKAFFQMKGRRTRRLEPQAATPQEPQAAEEDDASCPSKPDTGIRKTKAIFGRRQTHNEQLIVYPCGVIAACETFYGSETVPQLVVRQI